MSLLKALNFFGDNTLPTKFYINPPSKNRHFFWLCFERPAETPLCIFQLGGKILKKNVYNISVLHLDWRNNWVFRFSRWYSRSVPIIWLKTVHVLGLKARSRITYCLFGVNKYFFLYFHFLFCKWCVIESYGWELSTVQKWASNFHYWLSYGTLNF